MCLSLFFSNKVIDMNNIIIHTTHANIHSVGMFRSFFWKRGSKGRRGKAGEESLLLSGGKKNSFLKAQISRSSSHSVS